MTILFYLLIGCFAGLASGLLGIGGGVITVPALLLIFTIERFPEETIMLMAIGTSLASMVVSTFSSTYFHNRKNSVTWKTLLFLSPGILVGGGIGALVARLLPATILKIVFGVFACVIGFYSAKIAKIKISKHSPPNIFLFNLEGILIAFFSNILGIGGGVFTAPILTYYGYSTTKAVGTSSAFSCLISLFGAISYYVTSKGIETVPLSIGFIYLPAFLAISLTSFFSASYGVKLAHKLEVKTTRRAFAAMMVVIGVSMIFN